MAATHSLDCNPSVAPVLYIAFELSRGQWKLASSTARGQRPRIVLVPAHDTARVLRVYIASVCDPDFRNEPGFSFSVGVL
jgi:hypothetical protein